MQEAKQVEIPKMRTAATAIDEIKKIDPNTAITKWAIMQLLRQGEIPYIKVGRKHLFNVMDVMRYYAEHVVQVEPEPAEKGTIRAIKQ